MKKVFSMLAVAAFLFSINGVAQEVAKTSKSKTEKECAKKCDKDKKACCAGKKAEKKS